MLSSPGRQGTSANKCHLVPITLGIGDVYNKRDIMFCECGPCQRLEYAVGGLGL